MSAREAPSRQALANTLRLLSVDVLDQCEVFRKQDHNRGEYAILSQTWNRAGRELSFQDVARTKVEDLANHPAYKMVAFTRMQARQDGLRHFLARYVLY